MSCILDIANTLSVFPLLVGEINEFLSLKCCKRKLFFVLAWFLMITYNTHVLVADIHIQ